MHTLKYQLKGVRNIEIRIQIIINNVFTFRYKIILFAATKTIAVNNFLF